MRTRVRTVVAAIVLVVGQRAGAQSIQPCDGERAETEQFRIHIAQIGPRLTVASPLAEGMPFNRALLASAQDSLQNAIDDAAAKEEPARFRLAAVTVRCASMNAATKTVRVEIRSDRLVVPEGDTAGEVIDEASRFRLAGTQSYPRAALRADFDDRLGRIAGIRYEDRLSRLRDIRTPVLGDEQQLIGPMSIGGWHSVREEQEWYHWSLDASGIALAGDARGMHVGSQQQYWIEKIPFANGVLSSKGLGIGGFYEWQIGRADLRANVGLRWESLELRSPTGNRPRQRELAAESSFQQELTMRGGFFRYGGWTDHGFGDETGFTRGGLFARIYEDFPRASLGSWGFDIVGSGGKSGDVPMHRMFTGGNRLDPFLADRIHPSSEFTWAGPVLRGYGTSAFAFPLTSPRVPGMDYAGVSATVLLPGYSMPLVEPVDSAQKVRIDQLIQDSLDISVADMMTRRMRHGVGAQAARRRSLSEGMQLRNVLENLIRHGRRFSARPLFIFDAAQLRGESMLQAASIGGGVRLTGLSAGVEALAVTNIDRRLEQRPGAGGLRYVVRGYYRSGVRR